MATCKGGFALIRNIWQIRAITRRITERLKPTDHMEGVPVISSQGLHSSWHQSYAPTFGFSKSLPEPIKREEFGRAVPTFKVTPSGKNLTPRDSPEMSGWGKWVMKKLGFTTKDYTDKVQDRCV